jgi:hypothetical protein
VAGVAPRIHGRGESQTGNAERTLKADELNQQLYLIAAVLLGALAFKTAQAAAITPT